MLLGEAGRWHPIATAVWPDFVVVLPPGSDGSPGLLQRLEPLLVQALVPELAVEALDVAVRHRATRLDQDVPDAVRVGPAHERATGELRTVVGPHGCRVASEEKIPDGSATARAVDYSLTWSAQGKQAVDS